MTDLNPFQLKVLIFSGKTNSIAGLSFLIISCLLFFLEGNEKINLGYDIIIILFAILLFIRLIMFVPVKIRIINGCLNIKYLFFSINLNLDISTSYSEVSPSDSKGLGIGLRFYNKSWFVVPQVCYYGIRLQETNKNISIFLNNEADFNLLKLELSKFISI